MEGLLADEKGKASLETVLRCADEKRRGSTTVVHVPDLYLNLFCCEMFRHLVKDNSLCLSNRLFLPVDCSALCSGDDFAVILTKCCSLTADDALEVLSSIREGRLCLTFVLMRFDTEDLSCQRALVFFAKFGSCLVLSHEDGSHWDFWWRDSLNLNMDESQRQQYLKYVHESNEMVRKTTARFSFNLALMNVAALAFGVLLARCITKGLNDVVVGLIILSLVLIFVSGLHVVRHMRIFNRLVDWRRKFSKRLKREN
jgi:hypothetical protein